MTAIVSVLRTGCQWTALLCSLRAPSAGHNGFQAWRRAGVFEHLWEAGVRPYDDVKGLEWGWQAMDGARTTAPLGGTRYRAASDGRGNRGTQRSLLPDGHAIPLGRVVDDANRHALKRVEVTLEALRVERPEATGTELQSIFMDQGDDYEVRRATLEDWGNTAPHSLTRRGTAGKA